MKPGSITFRQILIIYISCGLLWCLLHFYILIDLGFAWPIAAKDSIISNITLAVLGFAMTNLLRYYRPGSGNAFNLLIWSLSIAMLYSWTCLKLLSLINHDSPEYILMLERSLPIRFGIAFLTIGWIVLLQWIFHTLKENKEYISKRSELERIAKEAELVNLRKQLQPHFLFNSLNSISALAGSSPQKARDMIQQLSDFLRGTLKKEEQHISTLQEEIKQVMLYLDIETVRFGHRLKTEINFNETLDSSRIPALLLQPLVENAVKYGVYGTLEQITICLNAYDDNGVLKIDITNPFDRESSPAQKSSGFGLNSVKRRLYLIYGRNDLLQIEIKNNIFKVSIIIPQQI